MSQGTTTTTHKMKVLAKDRLSIKQDLYLLHPIFSVLRHLIMLPIILNVDLSSI